MYEIKQTTSFKKWLSELKDKTVTARILSRLYRVEQGNLGDYKQINSKLFELRFSFGAGYRIYYTIKENTVIFLLAIQETNKCHLAMYL